MRRPSLLAFVLVFTPVAPAASQERGVVRGVVLDDATAEGIAHASVAIVGTTLRLAVGPDGTFRIAGVPPGAARVNARALGYRPLDTEIVVRAGDTTSLTIRMTAAPYVLGRVRTEAAATERRRFEEIAEVGAITMSRRTASAVPSVGEPDLLRVVQLLPGVTTRSDYTAGYNVRGGESDQNLVLLDGIPIYNPFHLGGMFSTFIDEMVSELELLTGGFPAPHGGRLSSVLDVRSAEEARQRLHGTASVSLLASSLAIGSALPNARDSWGLGLRRTYADQVIGAVTDEVLPYHFRDGQAHFTRVFRNGGTLSFTAYDGADVFDARLTDLEDSTTVDPGRFQLSWGNTAAGLTLAIPLRDGRLPLFGVRLGDTANVVQRLSVTRFRTGFDLGDGSLTFRNRVVEWRAQGALHSRAGAHDLGAGYEASSHDVRYIVTSPATDALLYRLEQRPGALALWAEDQWRAGERLLLRGGVRGEMVGGTGRSFLSPRAAAKIFLSRDLAVTLAGGRHAQWMHSLRDEDLPVRIFDFWLASDAALPVSTAWHGIAGVERWFGDTRLARVEGWIKRYYDLLEPNPADDPDARGDEFLATEGGAYGVDVHLRQFERGPFSGWLSYGYGLAKRWRAEPRWFPAQDRRHSLQAIAAWRLPDRWMLSTHFGFGTGTPYTPIIGQIVRRVYDGVRNGWDTGIQTRDIEPVGGERNSGRYPPYHRLDVSVEREFRLRHGMRLRPYAQIINLYDRRNVFTYTWSYTANPPTKRAISQFPIVPSIGFTLDF